MVVPSDRILALLWTHASSGHVGADLTLKLFKKWSHSTWSDNQLRKALQPIVDTCPCRSCKYQGYQGYHGRRPLFDPSYPTLCQQCYLCGLHGDA